MPSGSYTPDLPKKNIFLSTSTSICVVNIWFSLQSDIHIYKYFASISFSLCLSLFQKINISPSNYQNKKSHFSLSFLPVWLTIEQYGKRSGKCPPKEVHVQRCPYIPVVERSETNFETLSEMFLTYKWRKAG